MIILKAKLPITDREILHLTWEAGIVTIVSAFSFLKDKISDRILYGIWCDGIMVNQKDDMFLYVLAEELKELDFICSVTA